MEDAEDAEELEGAPEQVAGSDRIGNYSVAKISKLMSGIPSKPDWAEMERFGLNAIMQKCAKHWGHVSLFTLSIFSYSAFYFLLLTQTQLAAREVSIRGL